MERIVGTKSKGRSSSFSKSFYPVLKENTEFASKWIALCSAHLSEGIREPVKAYEFMNEFYIEEGNKRVSVLKYFGAVSVPANVTRIIPPQNDDKETRIYYEFMDFYSLSEINDICSPAPAASRVCSVLWANCQMSRGPMKTGETFILPTRFFRKLMTPSTRARQPLCFPPALFFPRRKALPKR